MLYREEMEVLREETDITKVNSRLAIVNQQQEVIDCERKLRQLLDTMAEFLLQLKRSGDCWCDVMKLFFLSVAFTTIATVVAMHERRDFNFVFRRLNKLTESF